jgi:cytosine/adenosine deaminase-related metal-dependent hydrolase
MMTLNPAKAAGAAERKGSLKPGYDADLVVLDDALTLQATYCRGALAFASSSWQARVEAGGQPLEPSQVIASASPSADPVAHRDSAPS